FRSATGLRLPHRVSDGALGPQERSAFARAARRVDRRRHPEPGGTFRFGGGAPHSALAQLARRPSARAGGDTGPAYDARLVTRGDCSSKRRSGEYGAEPSAARQGSLETQNRSEPRSSRGAGDAVVSVIEFHPDALLDRELNGTLSDTDRLRLAAHLERCAVC